MYNSNIEELKKAYLSGELDKKEYILKMYNNHRVLFDYSQFIKETNIKEVCIQDDRLYMLTRKNEIKLICDKDDHRSILAEILNFNDYEEEELGFIEKFIEGNMTIFDIGANIGYHSINISKFNSECEVYSFEPIIKTYNYLNENLEINNIKNVRTFNIALSNYNGECDFFYYPQGSMNASAANLNESVKCEKILCKIKKIDDFVFENNINKIDLIKCDTEGSELLVFKGAIATLQKFKPIIFTEMLRKWSEKFDYHPNDIILLLTQIGYECFTMRGSNLEKFIVMDEKTNDTNFVFLHTLRHKEYIDRFVK